MTALNPFSVKGPIEDPSKVVGRDDFARDIALKLKAGTNIAMFGPRKSGKSTFSVRLAHELGEEHGDDAPPFTTILINLERAFSIQAVISCVLEGLTHDLVTPSARRSVERELAIVETETEFSFKVMKHTRKISTPQLAHAEEHVLHSLLVALRRLDKHVVVIFDEFQRLGNCPGEPLSIVRSALMSQGSAHVSLLFTGSIRAALEKLFTDAHAPMFDQAERIELPRIERWQFADFLGYQFEATGKPISDDAIYHLLDLTDCHPYRTQQLAGRVWDKANASSHLDISEVQDAHRYLLDYMDADFSDRVAEMMASEGKGVQNAARVLHLIAAHGWSGAMSRERMHAYGLDHQESVLRARKLLYHRGLVEPDSADGWRVVDPLYETWLRLHTPNALLA